MLRQLAIRNVVLVEQDSYYRNLSDMPLDERHQANFDHPDSIDSDMLVNHLIRLRQGLSIEMPLYDFVTHTRSDEIEVIEPKPVVTVTSRGWFASRSAAESNW